MLVSKVLTGRWFSSFQPNNSTCACYYPKSSRNSPLRLATSRPLLISWVSFNEEKEATRASMRSRGLLISPEWIWIILFIWSYDSHGNKRWKRKKKAWTGVVAFTLSQFEWVSDRWDLKIWGQQRRRKRRVFAFFQSSRRLFQSSYLSKCMRAPLELNY